MNCNTRWKLNQTESSFLYMYIYETQLHILTNPNMKTLSEVKTTG